MGGNPCPTIDDASQLSVADMQWLAAHLGEESGFVFCGDDGKWRFRFFMPRGEVPMCVHATVAATTALVESGRVPRSGNLVVRTASGHCRITWDDGSPPQVTVEQQPPRFGDPADVTVLFALDPQRPSQSTLKLNRTPTSAPAGRSAARARCPSTWNSAVRRSGVLLSAYKENCCPPTRNSR